MRNTWFSIFFILLGVSILSTIPFVHAADSSSISNPSIETLDSGGNPIDWKRGGWGDIVSTMSVSEDSHSGSRSLKVAVESRNSGDAKWMHTPATVTPGQTYTYTSWYKSNTATEIDLQYTHTNGGLSYAYVSAIPASTQWDELTVDFTVPSGVSRVSVMHIATSAGWLLIDDVNLSIKAKPPKPSDENLISNGKFEYASNSAPLGWNKNSWGANSASFSYQSDGNFSKNSVKVKMTSHTSGDAKWYADPIIIDSDKQYNYSDYYKSTVDTWVVAAYIDTSGRATYEYLGTAPASTNAWKRFDALVSPPSGTHKLIVLHVIGKVGELVIDDVELREKITPQSANYIANGSLETPFGSAPHAWLQNNWGDNNAQFQYLNEGRTGDKSVKVTVSNYSSGDAKWYFVPTDQLTPGSQYKYSVWYKSNVTPNATAMFVMQDGSYRYIGLEKPKNPISTSNWQQYSDTFTVPTGAVATSVFFALTGNGWLQTDDYSLSDYSPEGFDRALLTLTFDDGYEGNAYTALPILDQYNLPSTHCYLTEYPTQAKVDSIMAFVNSGHEICSHTVSHPYSTQLSIAELTYELTESKRYLESVTGLPVQNFVTPYGDHNQTVINEVKKYYKSHRSVEAGYNSKDNFDRYNIKVQNVLDTTTTEEVMSWVKQAQNDNTWLVLVYHKVIDDPGRYDTSVSEFASQMNAISQSGIAVRTYNDALDEVLSQF